MTLTRILTVIPFLAFASAAGAAGSLNDTSPYATAAPRPLDLSIQTLDTSREVADAIPLAGDPVAPQPDEKPGSTKKKPPPASVAPMFRQTEAHTDPNTHSDFFQRHEFGLQILQPL
jgi:hypothetical protein